MEPEIKITKNKKRWINQNIELVTQHRGKWIGISETKGLIAASKDYDEFEIQLKKFKGKYHIWFVNENMGKRQVLMVRTTRRNFFSIKDDSHYWEP